MSRMNEQLLPVLGQVIRSLRLEKKISQEKFADMCGLHRTYVSDIELGKRNVSLENIERMSDALKIKISELFRNVEENEGI